MFIFPTGNTFGKDLHGCFMKSRNRNTSLKNEYSVTI